MNSESQGSDPAQGIHGEQEDFLDFASRRFGIYILGAGFSKLAGLPLANQLWDEIKRRADYLTGRAIQFFEDIQTYIAYKKDCDQVSLTPSQVNFEEFVAFLDVEHYLGLRGSDTWSTEGNETQVIIKTLIGEIITALQPPLDSIPDVYLQFAKILKPNDIVLTFNYDTLLERALEATGVPFRLFPDRYKESGRASSFLVDTSKKEVIVLKMHGSIDWFNRETYDQLEAQRIRDGFAPGGEDPIFQRPEELGVVPLVDGPRYPDDPLLHFYRVKDVEQCYGRALLFRDAPMLLNPSSAKILYSKALQEFWYGLGKAGVLNFKMAIIGFSLPAQDEYARQGIYRLVKNYQSTCWDENVFHLRKTPLVLIDFRETEREREEYKKRYSFVNWDRAITHFGGFGEEAVDLLRR